MKRMLNKFLRLIGMNKQIIKSDKDDVKLQLIKVGNAYYMSDIGPNECSAYDEFYTWIDDEHGDSYHLTQANHPISPPNIRLQLNKELADLVYELWNNRDDTIIEVREPDNRWFF